MVINCRFALCAFDRVGEQLSLVNLKIRNVVTCECEQFGMESKCAIEFSMHAFGRCETVDLLCVLVWSRVDEQLITVNLKIRKVVTCECEKSGMESKYAIEFTVRWSRRCDLTICFVCVWRRVDEQLSIGDLKIRGMVT
jgi:hypothetical protein